MVEPIGNVSLFSQLIAQIQTCVPVEFQQVWLSPTSQLPQLIVDYMNVLQSHDVSMSFPNSIQWKSIDETGIAQTITISLSDRNLSGQAIFLCCFCEYSYEP